jgi:GH15 family glucan-1,4-alpha-glucosidase
VTGDEEYLRAVYPAIRRAADYLVECRDPRNGLQCPNFEDDRFAQPDRQTINGAAPAWRALKSAAAAAQTLGKDGEAERYEERMHELGRAIDRVLYDVEEVVTAASETASPMARRPGRSGSPPMPTPGLARFATDRRPKTPSTTRG